MTPLTQDSCSSLPSETTPHVRLEAVVVVVVVVVVGVVVVVNVVVVVVMLLQTTFIARNLYVPPHGSPNTVFVAGTVQFGWFIQ